MKDSIIKIIAMISVGLIFLIVAIVCPLPMMLAISGIIWRIIIALIGCLSLALGIHKIVRKK